MNIDNLILSQNLDRRQLLKSGGAAGLGLLGAGLLAGCGGNASPPVDSGQDQAIFNALATAEAALLTMYFNIIVTNGGIYKVGIANNPQDLATVVAAYEQELNHYNFLVASGGIPIATTFFYPTTMFVDPQTTVNTWVTLLDTFIAAYLIAVRDFSTGARRMLAAQILGVLSEQRASARAITKDLQLSSVTGLGGAEGMVAPNNAASNLAYERTFASTFADISAIVTALNPYIVTGASGFDPTAFTLAQAATAGPSAGQPTVALANTAP